MNKMLCCFTLFSLSVSRSEETLIVTHKTSGVCPHGSVQRLSTDGPWPTDGPKRSFRWAAKRFAIN